jgi:hypothetical protein
MKASFHIGLITIFINMGTTHDTKNNEIKKMSFYVKPNNTSYNNVSMVFFCLIVLIIFGLLCMLTLCVLIRLPGLRVQLCSAIYILLKLLILKVRSLTSTTQIVGSLFMYNMAKS